MANTLIFIRRRLRALASRIPAPAPTAPGVLSVADMLEAAALLADAEDDPGKAAAIRTLARGAPTGEAGDTLDALKEALKDWRTLESLADWNVEELLVNAIAAVESAARTPAPLDDAMRDMEARKDAAYLERNRVVAALAWMAVRAGYRVSVTRTAIEGWSDDWHGCVYIQLPTGQASWHFHDSQAYLFDGLPRADEAWDGHTTEEKYARLARMRELTAPPDAQLVEETRAWQSGQPIGVKAAIDSAYNLFDRWLARHGGAHG